MLIKTTQKTSIGNPPIVNCTGKWRPICCTRQLLLLLLLILVVVFKFIHIYQQNGFFLYINAIHVFMRVCVCLMFVLLIGTVFLRMLLMGSVCVLFIMSTKSYTVTYARHTNERKRRTFYCYDAVICLWAIYSKQHHIIRFQPRQQQRQPYFKLSFGIH